MSTKKQQIVPFVYGDSAFRALTNECGELWFVAKDVAAILEYSETEKMTRRLDADEVSKLKSPELGDLSRFGNNDVTIINESGLYNAILGSQKPQARQFKKWVTSEVLPSIRERGYYANDALKKRIETLEKHLIPDFKMRELRKIGDYVQNIAQRQEQVEKFFFSMPQNHQNNVNVFVQQYIQVGDVLTMVKRVDVWEKYKEVFGADVTMGVFCTAFLAALPTVSLQKIKIGSARIFCFSGCHLIREIYK